MAKKTTDTAAVATEEKKLVEINFVQILENAKRETQGTLDKVTGKVEMLDEIIQFFNDQKFKVVKEMTQAEIDTANNHSQEEPTMTQVD